jgi:hypothetical protein
MTKKEMWAEIVELGLGEWTAEMHLKISCLTLSVPSSSVMDCLTLEDGTDMLI